MSDSETVTVGKFSDKCSSYDELFTLDSIDCLLFDLSEFMLPLMLLFFIEMVSLYMLIFELASFLLFFDNLDYRLIKRSNYSLLL